MPEAGVRSPYSQCPIQIYMCDDDPKEPVISTGTAFVYEFDKSEYLITNWHNVTGRHFLTQEHLSTASRTPMWLQAKIATYVKLEEQAFTTVSHRVELYDELDRPLWYEHPDLGSKCDVVAIPFERPEHCPAMMHHPANRISDRRTPIKPGNPVFLVGFPSSISVGFGLPLWKSGYIASEPSFDVVVGGSIASLGGMIGGHKLPAFFVDSQTRSGMSGSPVFSAFHGTWDLDDPYAEVDPSSPNFWKRDDVALFMTAMEFVGCYSARVGRSEEGAALGLCWGLDVLSLVCEAQHIGDRTTDS